MNSNGKPPVMPQSAEAERALLGGLILDPEQFEEVSRVVDADEFYRPEHVAVFRLLAHMRRTDDPIDMVTVPEHVARFGDEQFGGLAYVLGLTDAVTSTTNLKHYAKVIRNKARQRRAIDLAHSFVSDMMEGRAGVYLGKDGEMQTPEQMTEALAADLSAIYSAGNERRTIRTTGDLLQEQIDRVERRTSGLVRMPFGPLQREIRAILRGTYILLCAKPGAGKTAFLQSWHDEIKATTGAPQLQAQLELSHDNIGRREAARRVGISQSRLIDAELGDIELSDNELDRLYQARNDDDGMTYIAALPATTVPQLEGQLRQMARMAERRHGIRPSAASVDFIQLVEADGNDEGIAARMKFAGTRFKTTLAALNVAGLMLSQLNQFGIEASDKPDARFSERWVYGGGFLNMLADATLYLSRDMELTPDIIDVFIYKERNFGAGGRSLQLSFDGPRMQVGGATSAETREVDRIMGRTTDRTDFSGMPPKPTHTSPPIGPSGLPDYSGGQNFDAIAARGVERAAQRDEGRNNAIDLDARRRAREDGGEVEHVGEDPNQELPFG